MTALSELYQSVILDHNRAPRNFRPMPDATRDAEGFNPQCGDKVRVWVRVIDARITDVSFQGEGCAISQASSSMMTQAIKGRTVPEALTLFDRFHELVTGAAPDDTELGKLAVFGNVSAFPIRVKCASLGWHALRSALESASAPDR